MGEINQTASALAVIGGPREGPESFSRASQSVVIAPSGQPGHVRFEGLGLMFGDTPRRKVLCPCGAIAEFDSAMASRKKGLGKTVECRACRNKRIAVELEALDAQFNGEDLHEDGL